MVEIEDRKRPKVIGICTARGGSTRLPNKNARMFCGRPLLAWTVIQAVNSLALDEMWVTTDDEENAEIARKYGAKVQMREREGDNVPGSIPIARLIEQIADPEDIIVILFATNPLRKVDDIDNAVRKYLASPDHGNKYLIAVNRIWEDFCLEVINDDCVKSILNRPEKTVRYAALVHVQTARFYKENILIGNIPYTIPYFIEEWQAHETDNAELIRFAELMFYDKILSHGFNPYEEYRKGGLKI